jgi:hypothetical protein
MKPQEKVYLEIFKKQSQEILGWGNSEEWSNSDFEKLSELIFEKTGVNLSISTLKRVWGKVRYDSIPTTTTLNTLAQFSGYESWRSFCTKVSHGKELPVDVPTVPPENNKPVKIKTHKPFKFTMAVIAVIVILIAVFVWMSFFKNPALDINPAKIVFTSKTVSDELPNSVVFTYDVGKTNADSVVIQQSWDPRRRETVPANQRQHTSIYYYPGFFKAKLLINNHILSEHEVIVKTDGWKGIIEQQQPQLKPVYLNDKDINNINGEMHITQETLKAKTGRTVFNDLWTGFYNVKEFNVNPDNFTLTTTLQNTSPKEAVICQQVKINVITSDGFISLPLCSKGCTSAISFNVADAYVDGKAHDLSALGCDFSKPQLLKLVVKDKKALIYLNNRLVLTEPYAKPLGRIVGLMVFFEGAGQVKNIDIR